jgi:glycosyltransferase involved in cell wall biosynthesis
MKIGVISFELTTSGGDQRLLLRLARSLRKFGHEICIYAYRFNPSSCYPALTREFDIRAVHVITDEYLAVCRSSRLGILGVAARRYFLESRYLERFLGDVDVLNPIGRPAHRSAVFLKRRTGIPIVWNCNDVVAWEQPDHRARVDKFTNRIVSQRMRAREKEIVSEIDAIAVLSEGVRQVVESAYGHPAHVVYAGVDSCDLKEQLQGRRKIREKFGVDDGAFVALWFGLLEPFRRIEDMLHAAHILLQNGKTIYCLIVGRTDTAKPYAAYLKDLVSRLDLQQQVQFVEESIREEDLADYYSACDVFVFPNDQQSWGLAPLEALSCRRPVIVSRGSGVHEVLRHEETALLVPARNPEAIAKAISRIIDDPMLAETIANRGREFVASQLTWDNFAVSVLELMEQARFNSLPQSKRVSSFQRIPRYWAQNIIAATEPVWRIR